MSNNVLIVDDEVELTQILREYFHFKKGYNVLTATDGKVALNIIKEQTPAVVLLDMKLPSVNGIEILKVLRKDYTNTKVIVMTAYDLEYKKEIDLIGYDAFFIKPIAFGELKDKVDELLTGKTPAQPAKTKTPFKEIIKETKPLVEDKENFLPKARIAIIEIRGNVAMLLKEYLEHTRQDAQYNVSYFKSGSLFLNEIAKFKPDIILYDIVEIGTFSDFASELMKLPNPPQEIILFGDPKFKWEEVDLLIKRGMDYIPTPLASPGVVSAQYRMFELPAKETVERLSSVIKEVCFKHGLVTKKGEQTHG